MCSWKIRYSTASSRNCIHSCALPLIFKTSCIFGLEKCMYFLFSKQCCSRSYTIDITEILHESLLFYKISPVFLHRNFFFFCGTAILHIGINYKLHFILLYEQFVEQQFGVHVFIWISAWFFWKLMANVKCV